MSYLIIGDSCMDLTPEKKKDPHFQLIPLTLQVEEEQIVDDESFDQLRFIRLVAASPECPKSACPAPEAFLNAYLSTEAEMIFVITLSEHLSGTYNSAMVAKRTLEEEHKGCGKQVAVFSSDSASCGEALLGFEIQRLAEAGLSFDEIVKRAADFRDRMSTFFVLETLESLRKNGRLSGIKAFFASALNIKPVMGADHGVIIKVDQARGINRALVRMVETVVGSVPDQENRTLGIAHCNCPDRAEFVKEEFLKRGSFRDVYITETAGVSTLYASDGGIIVAC
ncbi:DegV family protein [Cuneatibacter caecimuris]|uniref:DegV family protein with EDD domain n=1 Tax=Cuneatibacter caecimuris TaxID=1796618 RepID=A0A4V2F5J0_9FIRM|nr:DegV family protein [Cuneatibacter caecimuris]RZS92989.1 DegV family protein with EDD domain [Cuneatibacter caecimuris]